MNLSRLIPYARILLSFAVLWLVLFALAQPHPPIPALARFLEPFGGVWVAPDDELKAWSQPLHLDGLKGPVTVRFDQNRIPHVFAGSDEDLYFAEGYLVASDRLWQMEFISRVASGRLSEIMGPRTLEFDKMFVKLGLQEAAAESLQLMLQDELTRTALESYTRGVNAYIESMQERDLPFEYKLLGHRPEAWEPLKTALLMKFMAFHLSFYSNDLSLTRSASRVSPDDFAALFPLDLPTPAPIIPVDTKWAFKGLAPEPPEQQHQVNLDTITPYPTPHPGNGSNNWAVMGKKSTTGKPIVSNDVHLGYTLPSLWYEIQLHSPAQNTYGVTLPGAPGIVLGFNKNVAWAVTNGGTDVVDWFDLRFRDEHRQEYLHDGKWRPVTSRDHTIKVRGKRPVSLLLRKTHFGPIVYDQSETPMLPSIPRGLAMRWGALEASNELKTFLLLNRASDFASCREAIESYNTPAQNFICADQKGDVGIFHEGRYPVRWRGQGRLISDGTDPRYDWHGYLPREEIPLVINPARGFVSSANQAPTDAKYPHYLGWNFDVPYRGMRINEVLESKAKFAPEDLVKMQSDSLMGPAREILPTLLKNLPKEKLGIQGKIILAMLAEWDYRADAESAEAVFYQAWREELHTQIWSDQFPDRKQFFEPRSYETAQLILHDPNSKWFDRIETEEKETLPMLLEKSFQAAQKQLSGKFGVEPSLWKWANYQPTVFPHFGRIPGLGSRTMRVSGHAYSIFANRGDHGPVWKSVVALGTEGRAWGIYPGGQSGHPASRYYDNFLEPWAKGELKELEFLPTADAPLKNPLRTVKMEKGA